MQSTRIAGVSYLRRHFDSADSSRRERGHRPALATDRRTQQTKRNPDQPTRGGHETDSAGCARQSRQGGRECRGLTCGRIPISSRPAFIPAKAARTSPSTCRPVDSPIQAPITSTCLSHPASSARSTSAASTSRPLSPSRTSPFGAAAAAGSRRPRRSECRRSASSRPRPIRGWACLRA